MATFDGNIISNVNVDESGLQPQGFGVVLLAAEVSLLGGGFTERFRTYETPADVADDPDITAGIELALNTALAQSSHTKTLAVGRVEADVAQVSTVTYATPPATLPGDAEFEIDINGVTYGYSGSFGETPLDIAAAIAPVVDADPNVSAVDSGGGVVTITASVAGEAFTISQVNDDFDVTLATPTPNVSIETELDALLVAFGAAGQDFYGVHPSSRAALQIERAASWGLVNGRLMIGQSSDADNLTAATTSIMDTLKTDANEYAGVDYHSDDAEWAVYAWMVKSLSTDPDLGTTTWDAKTLATITPQTQITTTEKNNLLAKNGNVYLTLGKVGATGDGKLSSGIFIDLRITADWSAARIAENIKELKLSKSNSVPPSKINFDDGGIGEVNAEIKKVGAIGAQVGHFDDETFVTTPPRAAGLDKSGRAVVIPWTAVATGAIQSATINGNIKTTL